MIKLAQKCDKNRILDFCSRHPLGVYIVSRIETYGFDFDFVKVWFSERNAVIDAVIMSFEDSFTICAEAEADYSEIYSFVNMLDCKSLCAEKSVFEKCGFPKKDAKQMFVYRGDEKDIFSEVGCGGKIKDIYELICESIPNSFSKDEQSYLHFLSDFTFRQKRGAARVKTVCHGEKVLSCALTAAESKGAALISGVACNPLQRGKGYGKKTVLTLANELKSEEKKVYVIALNSSAQNFYKKIGFEECIKINYMGR